MAQNSFFKKSFIWIVLLVVVLSRMFHFGNEIDSPHAWRQYDTKQYIDSYLYHDAKFLEPEVCWMGDHKKLALEFPLPEFLAAKVQLVFGESLIVLRLFFLIFFLLSSYFLYLISRFYLKECQAGIVVVFFSFTPLSLFYSRAIHIDFFALSFAFGMFYFCLKAIRDSSFLMLVISMVLGVVAFVEKAPYVFYLVFPILVFAYQDKKIGWLLKRAVIFAVPVGVMLLWVNYTKQLNTSLPDLNFIPNYNKFTEMWYWYFGVLDQRLNTENWLLLYNRLFDEVLGITGSVLFVAGLFFSRKDKFYFFSLFWLFGAIAYVLIFFNLNVIHNYYQIPFIAPLVLFVYMGIISLNSLSKSMYYQVSVGVLLVIIFASENVKFSELNYYKVNNDFNEVAQLINQNSTSDDVVVVSYGGLSPQCPLILQPAGRFGWSIPVKDLTSKLAYEMYEKAGATKLAIVYGGYFEGEFRYFFEAMENKKGFDLSNGKEALYMCDLVFNKPE